MCDYDVAIYKLTDFFLYKEDERICCFKIWGVVFSQVLYVVLHKANMAAQRLFLVLTLLLGLALPEFCGVAEGYKRPPARKTLDVPAGNDNDSNTPEQVHISLVGVDKMRISWMTPNPSPATVDYGTSPGSYSNSATGTTTSYSYLLYKSGEFHYVDIGPLKPNSVYYYRCGSSPSPEFSFKTPPATFPLTFAVAGDLGQTEWTAETLQHISKTAYDVFLLPGDLSYADFLQDRWDSFGRLVQPLASQRPWMVTQGNHEIEKIPVLHSTPFTAYNSRWRMPYQESGSDSNLYYSFNVAGVHVIMLGSYTDFDPASSQYKWLKADLTKVDRGRTPWIVVIIHAPWYNSNEAHQGESESIEMKASMEELLYNGRVDLVFAGHVHAYERFTRVYKDKADECGPVHITIGDGGNREGLATKYIQPKPAISMFREASFGHGQLQVVNETHALWTWHRNQDNNEAVASDNIWLTSLLATPACKK